MKTPLIFGFVASKILVVACLLLGAGSLLANPGLVVVDPEVYLSHRPLQLLV